MQPASSAADCQPASACPACLAQDWTTCYAGLTDRLHGARGTFSVEACDACGLLRLSPVPPDLSALYPSDYYAYADIAVPSSWKDSVRRALWSMRFHVPTVVRNPLDAWLGLHGISVELLAHSPRHDAAILDVGCGAGSFVAQGARLGLRARGVDIDDNAIARARAAGLDCHTATAAEVAAEGGVFDIVRLSHVLEHLPDPAGTLAALKGILAPGGRLLLALPNTGGLLAELYGSDWFQLDVPRHLWGFSTRSVTTLLERCGFHVMSVQTKTSWTDVYHSLRYRDATEIGRSWPETPPLKLAATLRAVAGQLDAAGRGDSLYLVASSAK